MAKPLAYTEGFHAFLDNSLCPYDPATQRTAWDDWCNGWDAAWLWSEGGA